MTNDYANERLSGVTKSPTAQTTRGTTRFKNKLVRVIGVARLGVKLVKFCEIE
ncbi:MULTISPECIES: hypothetical protein [unclassified Thioalkalivibrio]|uniref:hypothetical protein n=1 Tax=unclassified Thioalkalivibrio TaxID=2621013 RepID=UPI0012DEE70C|nr:MULTISPECIES: hypothetical protein [unclassified Thioalkalivibrio]